MRSRTTSRGALLSTILTLLLLAGCERKQAILYTGGPGAGSIAWLSWFVFILFCVVTVIMWALIFVGILRRRGSFNTHAPVDVGGGQSWMAIGGFAIPVVILFVLFV
jgi:cytochrome c oxidase subunit II